MDDAFFFFGVNFGYLLNARIRIVICEDWWFISFSSFFYQLLGFMND